MDRCVIPIKDPCPKENGYDPTVGVGSLLLVTFIDSIVELFEDSISRLEATGLRSLDRELYPVHHEQDVKNHNGEAKVPLEDPLIDHIRCHGEEHPDGCQKPGKPSFSEDLGIGVMNLNCKAEEIG